MSTGIGHFAFGATGTLVMIQMLPLHVRLRIRIAQVFIVLLGGAWALFPDLSKHTQRLKFINVRYWTKLGLPNLDRFINLLSAFHDSRWANISFLHHVLDIVDHTDSICFWQVKRGPPSAVQMGTTPGKNIYLNSHLSFSSAGFP